VVGVGALNFDRLYRVPRVAKPGEEVMVNSRFCGGGGSAANTIVGLARLGLETGFIGMVGKDIEGDLILSELRGEGVDIGGISHVNGDTGEIIGLVDMEGERVLYAYPGVNNELVINDQKRNYAGKAKYVHLSSFVGDTSLESQRSLLGGLRANITFSPGMLYARRGINAIRDILQKSHIVFLNREELYLLTGKEHPDGVEELLNLGVEIVSVTLGKEGCYVSTQRGGEEIPGYPARAVDTTGAGDAFAAGFIFGMLKNFDLRSCGKLGNKLASLCVEAVGARTALPRKNDIQEFISSLR